VDAGAIFLILAVVLLAGIFIAQPYLERRGRRATQEQREYSALMAEYDRVLNSLQELEFDNALGKIPAEDYPAQRAALMQKGASLLREVDALAPADGRGRSAQERLEAAVAARRADAAASKEVRAGFASADDDELESLIAARRKERNERSGGFCPRCGKPVLASDKFCPHCGKAIG